MGVRLEDTYYVSESGTPCCRRAKEDPEGDEHERCGPERDAEDVDAGIIERDEDEHVKERCSENPYPSVAVGPYLCQFMHCSYLG